MKTTGFAVRSAILGLMIGAVPALAQETTFGDKMGPIPVSTANRAKISGSGAVTATLEGTTLNIEGTYRGLSADASGAAVYAGQFGIAGADMIKSATLIDTIPASGTEGTFSGSVELTPEQVELLNGNGLFVVMQTSANPEGEIRGWLVAGNAGVDTALQ